MSEAPLQRKKTSDAKKKEKDSASPSTLENENVIVDQVDHLIEEETPTDEVLNVQQATSSIETEKSLPRKATSISLSQQPLERVTSQAVSQPRTSQSLISPAVKKILPKWIEKPHRWVSPSPKQKELLAAWIKEWADFLLKWAEVTNHHIVRLLDLQEEFPFNNPIIKKKLSLDDLQLIGEYLVENGYAVWLSSRKDRLRVYWKTLEEFSDDIYEWAYSWGHEVVTLLDLVQANEPWSNLPRIDLKKIMELLVKTKRAEWASKKDKTVIKFIYL